MDIFTPSIDEVQYQKDNPVDYYKLSDPEQTFMDEYNTALTFIIDVVSFDGHYDVNLVRSFLQEEAHIGKLPLEEAFKVMDTYLASFNKNVVKEEA